MDSEYFERVLADVSHTAWQLGQEGDRLRVALRDIYAVAASPADGEATRERKLRCVADTARRALGWEKPVE